MCLSKAHIYFSGYVLWQQGKLICPQPLQKANLVLLLNGDIFNDREDHSQSDTEWLANEITKCSKDAQLLDLFRKLEGPFSLIFFNRKNNSIYFARDSLGRQSLLIACDEKNRLLLSSVFARNDSFKKCIEIPPIGIFKWELESEQISLYPWEASDNMRDSLAEFESILTKSVEICDKISPRWLNTNANEFEYNFQEILANETVVSAEELFTKLLENEQISRCCDHLTAILNRSLVDRISYTQPVCRCCMKSKDTECSHARVGILFSGGIDCTILARLSDAIIDGKLPIDLINVSFEKIVRGKHSAGTEHIDYNTPDRISAKNSLDELKLLCPDRKWNLIEVNVTRKELEEVLRNRISHLVYPLTSVLDESLGAVLWFGANANDRVTAHPFYSTCRVNNLIPSSRIGITI